mgnify:FL=1
MTKKYDSSITRERITNLRNEKGVTQGKMAKDIGLKRSDIAHYETDRTVPIDKLYVIAKYFGTSADYLLGLTDSKSPKISDTAICNRIELKNKQVKILEKLKNDEIIDTINFLIEQEEIVLIGDIPPIEATKLNEIQYKKAEEDYYKELERIEKNCTPILSTIHNYFSIKGNEEDIYIMPNGAIKKLDDFKYKINRFLASETISTKEFIEEVLLKKIEKQLKKAKSNIEKGADKK